MPALCDMTCTKCRYRFGYKFDDKPPDAVYCPSCGHKHDMVTTNKALAEATVEMKKAEAPPSDRPELVIELDCWDCGERNRVREVGQSEAFCSACSTQLRLERARSQLSERPDVSTRWGLDGGKRSDSDD